MTSSQNILKFYRNIDRIYPPTLEDKIVTKLPFLGIVGGVVLATAPATSFLFGIGVVATTVGGIALCASLPLAEDVYKEFEEKVFDKDKSGQVTYGSKRGLRVLSYKRDHLNNVVNNEEPGPKVNKKVQELIAEHDKICRHYDLRLCTENHEILDQIPEANAWREEIEEQKKELTTPHIEEHTTTIKRYIPINLKPYLKH